jgi:hypothetical protein
MASRRGNSAMMRARSSALNRIQLSISTIVRPQPTHSAETGSSEQILLQGLSMAVMDRPVESSCAREAQHKDRGAERNRGEAALRG